MIEAAQALIAEGGLTHATMARMAKSEIVEKSSKT